MTRYPGLFQDSFSKGFWILIAVVSVGLLGQDSDVHAGNSDKRSKARFEKRLEFYLNRKSHGFISEMTAQEQMLAQFSKNVTRELKNRKLSGMKFGGSTGPRATVDTEGLVSQYARELALLAELVDQIEQLQKRSDSGSQYSVSQLTSLHEHLLGLLDAGERQSLLGLSATAVDESAEIDPSLFLSERLNTLARSSESGENRVLLEDISREVYSLNKKLGRSSGSIVDAIAEDYISEVNLLTDILEELEQLRYDAAQRKLQVSSEIEALRGTILASLDNTLLSIMGYNASLAATGPTVSDVFEQWKAVEYAKFQIKFTQYQIKKKWLLKNGTRQERDRMLEMDLETAFSNFIDGEYKLAQMEFDQVLQEFGSKFEHIETVLFYRAESNYMRKLYEEAMSDYSTIVSDFAGSQYFGDSLYRLMRMSYRSGNDQQFSKYLVILDSQGNRLDRETFDKCQYFAGYAQLDQRDFTGAEQALLSISADSPHSPLANYLLGIVYVNQDNYSMALETFKSVLEDEESKGLDIAVIKVRNSARLKLGLLYYELGEFEEAIKYLGNVAPGLENHDQSLAGAAWAQYKLGNFEKATQQITDLLQSDLSSQYTYEALVLAAHCKKVLQQDQAALADLRYVASARRVSALSTAYNEERDAVLGQLAYLDQLEARVLENRDARLFGMIAETRDQLEAVLASFPYYGTTGSLLFDQFYDERRSMVKQIEELDEIISKAYDLGNKKGAGRAEGQRDRLIKSLFTYQADKSIEDINYFLDYPLATKEGAETYRRDILRHLNVEIQAERRSIQESLNQIRTLQTQRNLQSSRDVSARVDLEILKNDLEHLQDQSSYVYASINESQPRELTTDFDQWAEFSGFGMSDLIFQAIKVTDDEIAQLAQNYSAIARLLETKRLEDELRAAEMNSEVQQLDEAEREGQIQNEKEKSDEFFRKTYFDTKERETEGQ